MSRILMLGAGECQLNLIGRLLDEGHQVHVSDYYEHSPGKGAATTNHLVSTFDEEANLEIVRRYDIDCVVTAGTDQPVKTIAYIQSHTGIQGFLTYEQSLLMTNKRLMKAHFVQHGIPTVPYQLIGRQVSEEEIAVPFPAVLKPVDSQGQRGIFRVNDFEALSRRLSETFQYTREDEVLLEQYYPSEEVTVTGWVDDGECHVLSITDRETFTSGDHIGICKGHRYPSRHFGSHHQAIVSLTEQLVDCFGILNGPLYFQMLIGDEGILVNEIAARLGGAYEDEYIPLATGVDLLGLLINRSLGIKDWPHLAPGHYLGTNRHLYVALIFSEPGYIRTLTPMDDLIGRCGVVAGKWFVRQGQVLPEIVNATQRIGYAIVTGESEDDLDRNLAAFHALTRIEVT